MDHQYIDDHRIAEKYLIDALAPEDRAAFARHFVHCDECYDRLQLAQIWLQHSPEALSIPSPAENEVPTSHKSPEAEADLNKNTENINSASPYSKVPETPIHESGTMASVTVDKTILETLTPQAALAPTEDRGNQSEAEAKESPIADAIFTDFHLDPQEELASPAEAEKPVLEPGQAAQAEVEDKAEEPESIEARLSAIRSRLAHAIEFNVRPTSHPWPSLDDLVGGEANETVSKSLPEPAQASEAATAEISDEAATADSVWAEIAQSEMAEEIKVADEVKTEPAEVSPEKVIDADHDLPTLQSSFPQVDDGSFDEESFESESQPQFVEEVLLESAQESPEQSTIESTIEQEPEATLAETDIEADIAAYIAASGTESPAAASLVEYSESITAETETTEIVTEGEKILSPDRSGLILQYRPWQLPTLTTLAAMLAVAMELLRQQQVEITRQKQRGDRARARNRMLQDIPQRARFVAQLQPWQITIIFALTALLLLLIPTTLFLWELHKIISQR